MTRLPITHRIVAIEPFVFVVSEVEIPEKEGDNWIKCKTILNPEAPLRHSPGAAVLDRPTPETRLFALVKQIEEYHEQAINRTRDVWEAEQ